MSFATNAIRRSWPLAVAAALLAALAPIAAPSEAAAAPRPVLLLVHGGGFFAGGPEAMDYAAAIAAGTGTFATAQPSYPLDDLPGAFARVKAVALQLRAQGRRVYAYGDSAGGGIATWLASRGYVRAAVGSSPPTALLDWRTRYARHYATARPGDPHSWRHLRASRGARLAYSAAYRPSLRPIHLFHSCADAIVPCAMSARFARRDPRVTMTRTWGGHGDPGAKAYSFSRGLRWLEARAGGQ